MTRISHFLKWLDSTHSVAAVIAAMLVFVMLGLVWGGLVIALLVCGSIMSAAVFAFGPPTAILYLIYRLETGE